MYIHIVYLYMYVLYIYDHIYNNHTSRKGGRLAAFGERPSHFGAARRSQMDITPLPNVSAAAKCRKRRKLKERKNGLCSESSET